jgi:hypothetical protein
MCAGKDHLLRVGPFIIARRYSYRLEQRRLPSLRTPLVPGTGNRGRAIPRQSPGSGQAGDSAAGPNVQAGASPAGPNIKFGGSPAGTNIQSGGSPAGTNIQSGGSLAGPNIQAGGLTSRESLACAASDAVRRV